MAKAVTPRKNFIKPTQQEVEDWLIKTFMDWPTKFCAYMARKFWYKYQGNGWIVGRTSMKDWHATFYRQWQDLKYREDKEMLEKCLMEPIHLRRLSEEKKKANGLFADQGEQLEAAQKVDNLLKFYDNALIEFQQGKLSGKALAPHYDRLKALGIMRLPKPQIDQIIILKGNDNDRAKALSVEALFQNLTAQVKTVKQFYYKIHRHATNDDGTVQQNEGQGKSGSV